MKRKTGTWYGGKKAFGHIKGMKDVFPVELVDYSDASTCTDVSDTDSAALFMCPVTKTPMNGSHAFVVVRSCGHVFSDKARKAVNGEACLICAQAHRGEEDVIALCGSDEQVAALHERLTAAKDKKKKRKREVDAGEGGSHAKAPVPQAAGEAREATGVAREAEGEASAAASRDAVPSTPEAGDTCAICITELKQNSEERRLPCGHRFHRHCIGQWLNSSRGRTVCPICKREAIGPGKPPVAQVVGLCE